MGLSCAFPLLSHKLKIDTSHTCALHEKRKPNPCLLEVSRPTNCSCPLHVRGVRGRTFVTVIDDILAEQVIVTEHHGGIQLGQVFLQPGQLLFQHLYLGDICRKAGQWGGGKAACWLERAGSKGKAEESGQIIPLR